MNNSVTCKNSCVKKGLRFCPSSDHRSGNCYNLTETFKKNDVCSTDIVSDVNLQYWACNYNINCTDNFLIKPNGFGTTTNLVTLTPKGNWIFFDNICTYLLTFPFGAGLNDTLTFKPNILTRISLYYMIGTSYSDDGVVSKGFAVAGTKYTA